MIHGLLKLEQLLEAAVSKHKFIVLCVRITSLPSYVFWYVCADRLVYLFYYYYYSGFLLILDFRIIY